MELWQAHPGHPHQQFFSKSLTQIPTCQTQKTTTCPIKGGANPIWLKDIDGRKRYHTSHIPSMHQAHPKRGRQLFMVLKISLSNYGSHRELHRITTVQIIREYGKRSETIPGLLYNTSKCWSKICSKWHDVSPTLRCIKPIGSRIKKQSCWKFFLGENKTKASTMDQSWHYPK